MINNRRRRGRPALKEGEVSTAVTVRLPATEYDRIFAQARARRVSVPEMLRSGRASNAQIEARLSALETLALADEVDEEMDEEMAASFAGLLRRVMDVSA